MNLDEFKDRAKEYLQSQWQKFQETPTYAQFKERYDDLPPSTQTLIKIGSALLLVIAILLPPLTWFQSSGQTLSTFEDERALLKEVLQVGRQMQEAPETIPQRSTTEVKQQVDQVVAGLQLLPEQVKGSSETTFPPRPGSHLIPSQVTAQGVDLVIDKVNLTQVIDLVYRLQSLRDSGIRVFNMDVTRSPGETHFFTTHLQVGSLALNTPPPPAPEPGKDVHK